MASSQRVRNHPPKPAAVNGFPYSVTRNVKAPVTVDSMIAASAGGIGSSTSLACASGSFARQI